MFESASHFVRSHKPTGETVKEGRRGSCPRTLHAEDRVASTGNHCPTSGVWEPAATPGIRITLHRGDVVPPLNGASAQWKLLQDWRNVKVPLEARQQRPAGSGR